MNTKKMIVLAGAFGLAASVWAETPEVTNVSMVQPQRTRRVTITYTLSAQAVVTLDVQTNCVVNGETKWLSIGGEALWNTEGDVWKKVDAGSRTITWRPDKSPWAGHVIAAGGARAVVTAWALDNTPNYMVVDIRPGAQANSQKYYPAADYLPGGLLENENYRKYDLVMRKIMAQGITWNMGSMYEKSRDSNETMHQVTLTNDYYIGVFQFTQAQWSCLNSSRPTPARYQGEMRPVEQVSYDEIRLCAGVEATNDEITEHSWPNPPASSSFIGVLNTRTGLDFDLPTDAQWEYACRAGNGEGSWNDGSTITGADEDTNLNRLGRYSLNGGSTEGTAVVGSYEPNSWGLYDMHGNVWEWCIDWYSGDYSPNGIPNINLEDPTKRLDGSTWKVRVARGGTWYKTQASQCRSARREYKGTSARDSEYGFRVVCRAGLD